jgi:hypothetical protein
MRRFEGSFSAMGASKVDPCLEDCTINTYGFNLRQGQPAGPLNLIFRNHRHLLLTRAAISTSLVGALGLGPTSRAAGGQAHCSKWSVIRLLITQPTKRLLIRTHRRSHRCYWAFRQVVFAPLRLNSAGNAGSTSALVPYKEQKALLSLEPVADTGRAAHDYSAVVAHN